MISSATLAAIFRMESLLCKREFPMVFCLSVAWLLFFASLGQKTLRWCLFGRVWWHLREMFAKHINLSAHLTYQGSFCFFNWQDFRLQFWWKRIPKTIHLLGFFSAHTTWKIGNFHFEIGNGVTSVSPSFASQLCKVDQ